MCWTAIETKDKIEKYADVDIPIYKVLVKKNHRLFKNRYEAPYVKFRYKLNKTYKTNIVVNKDGNYSINKAFHSFDANFVSEKDSYETITHIINPKDKTIKKSNGYVIVFSNLIDCYEIGRKEFKNKKYVLMKGYIPKGSCYYENKWGIIASSSIVITEEIPNTKQKTFI